VPDVICAGCGAICDDVALTLEPLRVEPRCPLAEDWFAARLRDGPDASVAGEPAEADAALRRAAELLRDARRPAVAVGGATVETARAAIALAERLGGVVDAGAADGALALHGVSTATFGEIRDRAGVVVVWRADPETTHPRLLERLRPRTLIVADDRDTATAARADLRLPVSDDVDALTRAHLRVKGLDEPDELVERLRAVPHAAFLHDLHGRAALALYELVRALNDERHVVTLRLGGTVGAADALTWQTGYTGAVDLGSGHPEPALAPEHDVALRVDADAVVAGDVVIRTAVPGLGDGGVVHRMDGVPLTLGAPVPSPRPTAADVLERLGALL
jgi:formylmethanofuran dehydrogenase subunit B